MNEVEQESWADFDITESSMSARVLHRVVRFAKPEAYNSFQRLMYLMRAADNAVDEGHDYQFAKHCIKSQWEFLDKSRKVSQEADGFLVRELKQLISDLPEESRPLFIKRYQCLLQYFHYDLLYRKHLKPYSQERLVKHRDNGFFQLFGAIKIILNGEDVDDSGNFRDLVHVWAKSEPIADLAEDLAGGLVLFSQEEGADWIKDLKVGEPVDQKAIDEYVKSIKGKLAQQLLKLAPAAFQEIGGVVGLLMSLDFVKRSIFLPTKKFAPKDQVVYGSRRFDKN